jgi:Protein of unknown function (DUF4238)
VAPEPLAAKHVADQQPENREYINKALAEGRIRPNVDENYIKGLLTKHLAETTFLLYQLDWTIIRNTSRVLFITSDNPSSVLPRRALMEPLRRFLPLAPDLAILAVADRTKIREGFVPDLSKPAPGSIWRGSINSKKAVALLNRAVVMNADEHVFSFGMERGARRLVRSHRDFGVAVDHVKIPRPDGHISASTLVVRQTKRGGRIERGSNNKSRWGFMAAE